MYFDFYFCQRDALHRAPKFAKVFLLSAVKSWEVLVGNKHPQNWAGKGVQEALFILFLVYFLLLTLFE